MPKLFISHDRTDEATASLIAQFLSVEGHDIWRNDQVPAHPDYPDEIVEQIREAKAVVVIWSAAAVRSLWVRAEAEMARTLGTLIQVSLDPSTLPLPFNQVPCIDLTGWAGDRDHGAWQKLLAGLHNLIGTQPAKSKPKAGVIAASRTPPMLAVLAFENLSNDSELTYFSDGVSEEIQQTVTRATDLRVIGRTSSFQFRGIDKSPKHVASELKATHILDGSVRRSGNQVRISAHLIECATGISLWADRFDRELTDIFALQDEIAAAVAAALKIAFAAQETQTPIDSEAFDLYLKARNIGVGRVDDSSTRIPRIELFEQVVALAPGFAPAWADLAMSRALQLRLVNHDIPYQDLRDQVEAAAYRSIKIDPSIGLAYSALAWLEPTARYVQREALELEALKAAPNDPWILFNNGQFCAQVGRYEQALHYLKQAHELDPLHVVPAIWYACLTGMTGRIDQSNALFDTFLQRWPESPGLWTTALFGPTVTGDWDRWDRLAGRLRQVRADAEAASPVLSMGAALRAASPEVSAQVLAGLRRELAKAGTVQTANLVFAQKLGLIEEAFDLMQQASYAHVFDEQEIFSAGLLPVMHFSVPANAAMMRDRRFLVLCQKLGLCNYWLDTDRWPDCVDAVAPWYDFKAEAGRQVAEAERLSGLS